MAPGQPWQAELAALGAAHTASKQEEVLVRQVFQLGMALPMKVSSIGLGPGKSHHCLNMVELATMILKHYPQKLLGGHAVQPALCFERELMQFWETRPCLT